jgi:hypothetical protein
LSVVAHAGCIAGSAKLRQGELAIGWLLIMSVI